jgi:hypothetical protein
MIEVKKLFRQGDLNFRKVEAIPEGLKKLEFDKERGGYTLALGEHSGHAHTLIPSEGAEINVWEGEDENFIEILSGFATLMHGTFVAPAKIQEEEIDKHLAEVLRPGIYRQGVETEYDPFAKKLNKVID